MSQRIRVSRRVAEALACGRAVVALESTVITHGLPELEGLEVAGACEEAVRESGAEPATTGVLDGRVVVGLSAAELERIASAEGVDKLNWSNLAAGLVSGGAGSTTVSATVWAARSVGIRVVSTGGIGGVHRGFAETGDVSADLAAMARSPVAVVCAGAKAVLDLPRTREALEALGVPVFGFRADVLPAFYRRQTDLPVDARFDQVSELADAVATHFDLDLGTGLVVANPVPSEGEMPRQLYETALDRALSEMAAEGLRGRAVTPFLLDRLRELTAGKSVFSNRALLLANARLAGRLAVALSPRRAVESRD